MDVGGHTEPILGSLLGMVQKQQGRQIAAGGAVRAEGPGRLLP